MLDFLWGYPTETFIKALFPQEISLNKHRIQLVQIGEKSGSKLTLPANALRTSRLEVSGGTKGITPALIQEGTDLVWEWFKQALA